MVFRKLPITLACVGLLAAACGEEGNTSSSIDMRLDSASCIFDSGDLRLSCQSTAVVIVRDASGRRLAGDCATLPSGPLEGAAEAIQDTLELGSLPADTALTISLSIYSGLLETCPLDATPSNPFLFGSTALVTLSQQSSPIPLVLDCTPTSTPENPGPGPGDDCEQCINNLDTCYQAAGLANCPAMSMDCETECLNLQEPGPCIFSCQLLGSFCTDQQDGTPDGGGVTLNCSSDENGNGCLLECQGQEPNEVCIEACGDAMQKCVFYRSIQGQCDSEYQGCSLGCDSGSGGTSCLDLGPGL